MSRYSENAVQDVLGAADIVDIVGYYVTLKRSGRNFTGLCPFHREKTPSFSVSPDKQIYKCFGCGEGGNAIQFLMKIENIDFKEALELLAERINFDLTPYIVDGKSRKNELEEKNKKDRLYLLNKDVSDYFYNQLISSNSKNAQEYIRKRQIDGKTLKEFHIGFGGNEKGLYDFLKSKGYNEEEILLSGVITKNEGKGIYERFVGRVIFPITDVRDRVIAFGGRVLDNSLPKYVNSPETIIYSKGKNLYALNVVKKEKIENIIIVEGYMDAIALHKAGIKNVVASLGTALTEMQGRLLRKYTSQVIILYDTDAAGQAATLRGIDILTSLGLDVKILRLDGTKDPDEYINKFGSEKFKVALKSAISLVEYKVSLVKKEIDTSNTDGMIKFLNQIANILSKVENNITRDIYINNISRDYGISTGPIISEINRIINKEKKQPLNIVKIIENKKSNNISSLMNSRITDLMALLLLNDRKILSDITNQIENQYIKNNVDELTYKTYEYILSLYNLKDFKNEDVLVKTQDTEIINKITDVMHIDIDEEKKYNMTSDIIKHINMEKLQNEIKNIQESLLNKSKYTNDEISSMELDLLNKQNQFIRLK